MKFGLLFLLFFFGCSDDSSSSKKTFGPSDPSDAVNGRTVQSSNNPVKRCTYEDNWTNIDSYSLESGQSAFPLSIDFSASGSVFVGGYAFSAEQTGSFAIVREMAAGSSVFTTADSYSYDADNNTRVNAIAVGTSGLPVYSIDEYEGTSGGKARGVTRTVDETDNAANMHDQVYFEDGQNTHILDVAIGADGSIYSVGWGFETSPTFNAGFLRISADGGATWTQKEFLVSSSSTTNRLYHVSVIDGDIFVSGLGGTTTSCTNNTVFVAKTSDEGDNWTILDSYCKESSTAAYPSSRVFKDSAGNLYYNTYSNTSGNVWEIRRSTDSGETWSTVEEYQHTAGKSAEGRQFVQGDNGILYNAGAGKDASNFSFGVILESADFGSTWTTSEETQLEEDYSAIYYGIAKDPAGDLWSILWGSQSASGESWHARRKSCE